MLRVLADLAEGLAHLEEAEGALVLALAEGLDLLGVQFGVF